MPENVSGGTVKAAEPDRSALRDRALELAIRASSHESAAPAIVAKALVFEKYLESGTLLGKGMYDLYAEQVRDMVLGNS